MKLDTPIEELKGVGESLAGKLKTAGIENASDLIGYFPRKYEDYSELTSVAELKPGPVSIEVKVTGASGRYVRRGMHITEAVASDKTGSVRLVWFNQPYREAAIKGDASYFVSGEFALRRGRFSITNPSMELASDFPVSTARIVPVYRESKGLKSAQLRKLARQVFQDVKDWEEHLPEWLIKEQKLISYRDAAFEMHFPSSGPNLAKAKRRLAFEEVFELTLAALLNKKDFSAGKALSIAFDEKLAKEFVSKLPFKLTDAQRKVAWRIYQDMEKSQPMNRLIEGDVGSGKTVVAAMAAVMAMNARATHTDAVQGSKEERASRRGATVSKATDADDAVMRREAGGATGPASRQAEPVRGSGGFQVALMAPTEILARQHANTLYGLLSSVGMETEVVLLIGGLKPGEKSRAHEAIATGQAGLMVGTHALISEKVDMRRLGLVIIDEQHRFGVEQRKKLQAKAGHMPHVLHMTATPIPRSLALTLYGELDISVLDELPPGRQPVVTKVVSPNSRKDMYETIKSEIKEGRQAFIVCPLISDSETSGGLSVEEVYKRTSEKDFKGSKVGLLHGRLKSEEKDKIMASFASGDIDILVTTTVIEVGVDVPNASVMVVEGAERFGLAQIHQLRGRIGRGEHKSYAFLVPSSSQAPTQRLKALETLSDGFKLAELDLELRGPGAIYGTFQHGALDLRVAKLTDTKLIAAARGAAQAFIDKNEKLSRYPHLASKVIALRAVTNLN